MLQSPSQIESLVKIFIHATKVCGLFLRGHSGLAANLRSRWRRVSGTWATSNVPPYRVIHALMSVLRWPRAVIEARMIVLSFSRMESFWLYGVRYYYYVHTENSKCSDKFGKRHSCTHLPIFRRIIATFLPRIIISTRNPFRGVVPSEQNSSFDMHCV